MLLPLCVYVYAVCYVFALLTSYKFLIYVNRRKKIDFSDERERERNREKFQMGRFMQF